MGITVGGLQSRGELEVSVDAVQRPHEWNRGTKGNQRDFGYGALSHVDLAIPHISYKGMITWSYVGQQMRWIERIESLKEPRPPLI